MTTVHEAIYCRESFEILQKVEGYGNGIECIMQNPGFESVCLNVWVLQTAGFQHTQECKCSRDEIFANFATITFSRTFPIIHWLYNYAGITCANRTRKLKWAPQNDATINGYFPQAIRFLSRAWKSVTPETISNCWKHTGIVTSATSEEHILDTTSQLSSLLAALSMSRAQPISAQEYISEH